MTMDKVQFISLLEKVENLPTLPVVVHQLQALIANPRSNISQISTVVSRDQAIASRVVRLINSAFYGLGGKITSIQHAIVLLGLNTVKNLVLGVSVVKAFGFPSKASLFNREKFWLHTLACALGAREVGKAIKASEPEDYFLAGLLHDIGILVLDQFFHEKFIEILQRSACNGVRYIDAEKTVLGLTHAEVGEFMAKKWKIPELLINTIRHHHRPDIASDLTQGSLPVICAVCLMDTAANLNGFDMGHPGVKCNYNDYALRILGLNRQRIEELFSFIMKDVKSAAKEWGV